MQLQRREPTAQRGVSISTFSHMYVEWGIKPSDVLALPIVKRLRLRNDALPLCSSLCTVLTSPQELRHYPREFESLFTCWHFAGLCNSSFASAAFLLTKELQSGGCTSAAERSDVSDVIWWSFELGKDPRIRASVWLARLGNGPRPALAA